jgi:hypothetical protein
MTTEIKSLKCDYNNFVSWYEKFIKRNAGWSPDPLRQWFDVVEDNHQELRQLIGDVKIDRKYLLKSGTKPLDINTPALRNIIDTLNDIAPNFIERIGITEDDFKYPVFAEGNHNGRRLSKLLRDNLVLITRDILGATIVIDKQISLLGEEWAKCKTSECELTVTLSTTQRGFSLLGHYGPDDNSCFRQGSTSRFDKYIFGQSKNTFILSIKGFDKIKGKERNLARAFGWYANGAFNVRNYYFVEGFQEGDFIEVITMMFSELLKGKPVLGEGRAIFDNPEYNGWRFYQNNYGNWTFYPEGTLAKNEQYLSLNLENILCFTCPHCKKKYTSRSYWKEVDSLLVCENCNAKAGMCDISRIKTLKQLVPCIATDGSEIRVHPDIAKTMHECAECGKTCQSGHKIGDKYVCSGCEAVNYSECELCQETTSDNEIVDVGDSHICKKCFNKIGDTEELEDLIYPINNII